jgi:hypothetical protein
MITKTFGPKRETGVQVFAITGMSPVRLTVERMNYDIPPSVAETARRQAGAISRRQLLAGHGGQQQPDARSDRGGQDGQPDDGLAAAANGQAQAEADHGVTGVSELTRPSLTMTWRSA